MTLAPGRHLGPCKILRLIGAGGMGEVYRARDTRLGRDVAVKVLPASVSTDSDRLQRFEEEARAAAALSLRTSSPSTTSTRTRRAQGCPRRIRVTELLEGETLRERLGAGIVPVRIGRLPADSLGRHVAERAEHDARDRVDGRGGKRPRRGAFRLDLGQLGQVLLGFMTSRGTASASHGPDAEPPPQPPTNLLLVSNWLDELRRRVPVP